MKKSFIEWIRLKEEQNKIGVGVKNPEDIKSDMEIKNALSKAATTGQDPEKALENKLKKDSMDPNKSPDDVLKTTEIIKKIKEKNGSIKPVMGKTK